MKELFLEKEDIKMTQIISIIALLSLCAGLAFGFVPVNVWSLLALLCLIIAAIKG